MTAGEASFSLPVLHAQASVLHPPTAKREYFTYGTFGLSIAPQAAGGPSPRLELVAYSEREDERVAQSLSTVARMIATATASDAPFKLHDTVDVGNHHFVPTAPAEDPNFARFPNEARRPGDVRFTTSVGASDEAAAQVVFLQLQPVSVQESKLATEQGTSALLAQFGRRPKFSGWEHLEAPSSPTTKPHRGSKPAQ